LQRQCMYYLTKNEEPTKQLCIHLVEMEQARINTSHPKFVARPENRIHFQEAVEHLAKRAGMPKQPVAQPEVLCEGMGWKTKAGPFNGGAKPRHFVLLRTGMLLWHIQGATVGADARGNCRLNGCTVVTESRFKGTVLTLRGGALSKGYKLQFQTADEASTWEANLNRVITDLDTATKDTARVGKMRGKPAKEVRRRTSLRRLSLSRSGKNPIETPEQASATAGTPASDTEQLQSVEHWFDCHADCADDATEAMRLCEFQFAQRKLYFEITYMARSYINIVQEQLQDTVPKAISSCLIAATRDMIDKHLGFKNIPDAVEQFMSGEVYERIRIDLERHQAELAYLLESQTVLLSVGSTVRNVNPITYDVPKPLPAASAPMAAGSAQKYAPEHGAMAASESMVSGSMARAVDNVSAASHSTYTSEAYLSGASGSHGASKFVEARLATNDIHKGGRGTTADRGHASPTGHGQLMTDQF